MARKSLRTVLHHYDNGDLEFIKRPIVGESTQEFNNENYPIKAWADYFEPLSPCNGYKDIGADAIQLTNERHFSFEVHDILSNDRRPPEAGQEKDNFISAIADARGMEVLRTTRAKSVYEKLTLIGGAVIILQVLGWGVSLAIKAAGG